MSVSGGKPWEIFQGDVRKVLRQFPDNHFDGCLTDPPYGLRFMGQRWDYELPSVNVWTELLRVLKPGAYVMLFGGSRTFHRLAVSVEDAGFELRDTLMWLYGSGFPKSFNIAKAVPRAQLESAEGEIFLEFRVGVLQVTKWVRTAARSKGISNKQIDEHFGRAGMAGHWTTQASQPALMSATEWAEFCRWLEIEPPANVAELYVTIRNKIRERAAAEEGRHRTFLESLKRKKNGHVAPEEEDPRWKGYGTALKPAFEPIVLACKPSEIGIAQTALKWNTGVLAIDASRVGYADEADKSRMAAGVEQIRSKGGTTSGWKNSSDLAGANPANELGRWPANVLLDEEAAAILDEQSGERPSTLSRKGSGGPNPSQVTKPGMFGVSGGGHVYGDNGGASRFFYTPKASRYEKECGLDDFEEFTIGSLQGGGVGANDPVSERFTKTARNTHPTIKPIELIRYFARLLLPPSLGQPRKLLVPFSGSGSEMIGAMQAGWDEVVGIEREAKYIEIAKGRIRKGGVFSDLLDPKMRRERESIPRGRAVYGRFARDKR